MKKMRLAMVAVAILSLTACRLVVGGNALKGEGIRLTKDTVTASFDEISVCQGIRVVYVQREGRPQLRLEAYENVMPRISVRVEDGELHLSYDDVVSSVNDVETVVTVYAPSLRGIEVSSAARVETDSLVVADELEIDASSAAAVTLRGVSARKVSADASSAAKVTLAGSCRTVDFDASSAAKIDAAGLKAETGSAEASSAAHVETWVSGELQSEASSAGSVSNKSR